MTRVRVRQSATACPGRSSTVERRNRFRELDKTTESLEKNWDNVVDKSGG